MRKIISAKKYFLVSTMVFIKKHHPMDRDMCVEETISGIRIVNQMLNLICFRISLPRNIFPNSNATTNSFTIDSHPIETELVKGYIISVYPSFKNNWEVRTWATHHTCMVALHANAETCHSFTLEFPTPNPDTNLLSLTNTFIASLSQTHPCNVTRELHAKLLSCP